MATRAQNQTAWAPWIKNLAEILEPYLVEMKHQGESKSWHLEPLASPHHVTLRKQDGCCHHQMRAPNLLGRHLANQTGEHQASHGIPTATPGINQPSPLGRLTPGKKKLNNKLKTSTQQREQKHWKPIGEGGRIKELISTPTSVNKQLERQKGQSRWVISHCLKQGK
jgi:hypothetical protein